MNNVKYNIVALRKRFFIISLVLIILIVGYATIFGVNVDIEFRGGAILTYSYTGDADLATLTSDIEGVLGSGIEVQTGTSVAGSGNTVTVTMPGSDTVSPEMLTSLTTMFSESYADNAFTQMEVANVDATMGREFFAKSIVAVIAAFVLILIYIAIRFRNIGGFPAGIMAIIALTHDLIIVFGVYVAIGATIGGNFIAVMLTILGYSINDTVVVYDRIRENEGIYKNKMAFEPLVNLSVNQSLVRSLNTTVSTIIALATVSIVALVFGLDSIFTFSFPLIIGMISGAYSSICIAGPLWVEWENRKKKKS